MAFEHASGRFARTHSELERSPNLEAVGRRGDRVLEFEEPGDVRAHELEVALRIPVAVRHLPTIVPTTLAVWPSRPSIRSSPRERSRASSPTRCRTTSGRAP